MLDITTIYLEDNTIKYIDYGRVSRDNNASNILRVISNYPLGYTMGISFILPNGRKTRRYKLLSDLPYYEELDDPHKIEITQDIIDKYKISENKLNEKWDIRYFMFPSTLLKRISTLYSETIPFSLNITKCLKYKEENGEETDECIRWFRANTETEKLAILPSVTADFDETNIADDFASELNDLYNNIDNLKDEIDILKGEIEDAIEDLEKAEENFDGVIKESAPFESDINAGNNKIIKLKEGTDGNHAVNKNQLDSAVDGKLDSDGLNADGDISINGTTFNYNRDTDAIEGKEFDERVQEVDDLLDLDGDL